jgi:hypothetical protein
MHKWLIIIIILLLSIPMSSQNNYAHRLDVLLLQLEDALEKGNPRALRELAGVIEEVDDKDKIIELLDEYTLFPTQQLVIDSSLTRQKLFAFLNEYEEDILYSPFLNAFLTQNIEEYPVDFKILRKRNLSEKEKSSLQKRYVEVLNAASKTQLEVFARHQLHKIAELQSYESYDFLLGCLEGNNLPPEILKANYIESIVCEALTSYDDPYVLQIILEQLNKGKISATSAANMLAKFTNVAIDENYPKKMAKAYQGLLDSLGTLSAIRNLGFEQENSIRLSFFEEPVDYYAYILSQNFDNTSMRENAIREMMATGNSRALFYLSATLFAERDGGTLDRKVLEDEFERYLDIYIKVEDNGIFKTIKDRKKSKEFFFNHAIYWSLHYQDYEYDVDRRLFINIKLEEENEASATRLFKKLTSENKEEAFNAFRNLSHFSPSLLIDLKEKYRTVLRRVNAELPDFRYGFLENIALLHEFCEIEGVSIEFNPTLVANIELLKTEMPIQERYKIEDSVIKQLQISDLTALEIEALVYSKNIDFSFSVSRVLDIYYSNHFKKITGDYFQLRLFLKKSVLFSSIGVGGISNKYFSKVEAVKEKIEHRLVKLSRKEYDEDIRDVISYMLPEDGDESQQAMPVGMFLEDPTEFGEREIPLVAAPNNRELKIILKEISIAKKMENVNKFIPYLSMHSSSKYTMYLIKYLENNTILVESEDYKRTVADVMVQLLEDIYEFSFSTNEEQPLRETADEWLAFAKKNKDIKNWGSQLFQEKINRLVTKEKISISEFNEILESDLCNAKIQEKCISMIYRLESPNNIRRLNPKELLPFRDLIHFTKLEFKHKYLDNVLELFDVKYAKELFLFSKEYIKDIPAKEAGKIHNKLCDFNWYLSGLMADNEENKNHVILTMNAYLNESDFLSEFEEKRILNRVFLLKYGNESIVEQLKYAIEYGENEEQVYNIQKKLLAEVNYDQLATILNHVDVLIPAKGESEYYFLEKKLGLPSYLFDTEKNRKQFREDVRNLSELEIYEKYLSMTGLDIFKSNQELDFEKIREVLEFDIVSPFSSTVSRTRMHFVVGVMQLLDGLYPNNNIEFMGEDGLRQQAQQWIEYLNTNEGKMKLAPSYSFNHND